jgi:serine/threonine protein kinase/tetratricopeptide (TPR) repeat protein
MSMDTQRVQDLFLAAVEQTSSDRRAKFLAAECGGDDRLRQRVEALLRAHLEPGTFLDQPAAGTAGSQSIFDTDSGDFTPSDAVPIHDRFGPYKLLQKLGEGGMGEVWMAEQAEPVKRRVALKLVRQHLESRHVIARFEQERQALAMMDHPNIAKVLDAGANPAGRPYFVMELVQGVPITNYCDAEQLSPKERLALFIPVCHAIQHAHQKGIIHRDLKPSNVIIALYDGKPVPKVIDFGIAKATQQNLNNNTIFTRIGQIVGTFEYMSPEQAEMNNDVDTRADVYSLGVLLYELLTGAPPFTKAELCRTGYADMLRIIREVEPARPSTKLSASTELPRLAAKCRLEPKRLTQTVHGELDWIVMKCLEKGRNRRYDTAEGLATDLQRYLADEPVQACPPSSSYRLRKFVRRNKGAVLAITTILVLLCAGILGTTWGLVRAEKAWQAETDQRKLAENAVVAEREATQKATREAGVAAAINNFFINDILRLSSPMGQVSQGVVPDANLKLRTALQRAAKRIDGKFANEPEVEMRIRYTIGFLLLSLGDNTGALPQFEKVAAYSRKLLGPDDAYTLNAEYRLACTHRQLGHPDIALPMLEENVERHKRILGETHVQTLVAMNGLAMTYSAKGQYDKALKLARRTLELRRQHLGPDRTDTLVSMNNLAVVYLQQTDLAKALPLFEETLDRMKAKLGPLHPERLNTTRNMAHVYHAAEQLDKALALQEMLVGQLKTAFGTDEPSTQRCIDELITYYVEAGQCDKAATLLATIQTGGNNRPTTVDQSRQASREGRHRDLILRVKQAADVYQKELSAKSADHSDTLAARQALAVALREQKHFEASAYHSTAVIDARQRLQGTDHPDTQLSCFELGITRLKQAKLAEATRLFLQGIAGTKQATEGRKKLDGQKKP